MPRTLVSSLVAATALLAAVPAAASNFAGDYDVLLNSADPGLKVSYQPIASDVNGLNFSLNQGQTATIGLFKLYTPEEAVNVEDDFASKPINVAFGFTLPDAFGGSVDGTTQGTGLVTFLGVIFDAGTVTWANGGTQLINFGNGGQLLVDLDDATFNAGIVDLKPGAKKGAVISADFTLLKESVAVPEPASWALMISGFGMAGAILRHRRRIAAKAFHSDS
jgi:ethanolamine utilization microcompartment shell protein EutS